MADVIVIGGGLSGLSAAKWLSDCGIDVLVLESRDRVGGRTYTVKNKEVNYVDFGGSYVGPTQDHLLRLSKELGVETYKINTIEDTIYYDGRRIRYKSSELPTFWNPLAMMDVNNLFRVIDRMGEEIPADAPWNAPKAREWDTTTVKEFASHIVWTKEGKLIVNLFLTLFIASEMYESSLLWFLWYIKQCGGSQRCMSTTNGGQERKFIGGSQQISNKIAERLGEKNVMLNKPVVGMKKTPEGFLVQTLDGTKHKGKYVILAMSPVLQMKIHYDPPLPPERNQLIQRMPIGSVIKTILYYREPFWKKKNCCGTMLIAGGDEHPVGYVLDDSKPDGSHPALIGFIVGDKARRMVSKSKEERKKIVSKSYAEAMNDQEALNPVHYEEYVWMSEQYSGGCYTSMCPPGFLTIFGKKLREPIGGMFFAGTETATHWSGYMEGAVQAGERAAREILCEIGRLSVTNIQRLEPPSQDVVELPFHNSLLERFLPSVPGFIKLVIASSLIATVFYKKDATRFCIQILLKRFV